MTNPAGRPVRIRAEQASFRKRLAQLRDQVRKRAYELYGRRVALGVVKENWVQAQRETALSRIAGIEDTPDEFRITAAVPDIEANRLVVDARPDSIVVEGEPAAGAATRRYSEFPLDARIDPAAVKAEISNGYLTIVAPKAETAEAVKAASAGRPT